MFTKTFTPDYTTSVVIDGTTFTAYTEHDPDTAPDDFECYSPEEIDAWKRDDWSFVGVIIYATRGGVLLGDNLASLWGIESNSSPEYFLEVANDLLREAIPLANEARKRIALAMA